MIMDCKYTELSNVSDECRDLIRQILQREPSDRIRIERIMEHAWFSDISPEDRFSPAKIQRFNPQILTKSKDHGKICSFLQTIAQKDEIDRCLADEMYNPITAAYFLF